MKISKEEYEQAKTCLKKYNYNEYIEQENQQQIKELEAIRRARMLISDESLYILEHLYIKRDMNKWEIIDNLHRSEETYKRRHKELVYAIHDELNLLNKEMT
jgi:hypothetical protein